MRTNFTRQSRVDPIDAIAASVPRAIHWPSVKNSAAALAASVEAGCDQAVREHLIHFAVRVGARHLADAAACLRQVGHTTGASIATEQARLVGALQHPLVTGDDAATAGLLRELGPTYDALREALER